MTSHDDTKVFMRRMSADSFLCSLKTVFNVIQGLLAGRCIKKEEELLAESCCPISKGRLLRLKMFAKREKINWISLKVPLQYGAYLYAPLFPIGCG